MGSGVLRLVWRGPVVCGWGVGLGVFLVHTPSEGEGDGQVYQVTFWGGEGVDVCLLCLFGGLVPDGL